MKRLKDKGGMIVVDQVLQPIYKPCSKCGIIKDIHQFHRQGKDVRRNVCRECRRKTDAIYRLRKRIHAVVLKQAA